MNHQWDFTFLYSYKHVLLEGLLNTLYLSFSVLIGGLLIGTLIAACRISNSKILRAFGSIYVDCATCRHSCCYSGSII
jgi:ABC-type amino acid transport system permease subunit